MSWNPSTILYHSSKASKRQSKNHNTSMFFKAHMTNILILLSNSASCFTMNPWGINRLEEGKPHGATSYPIGQVKISKLVLEALQSPRHKISHKISKKLLKTEIILTLHHFPSVKIAKRTFGKSRFLRFKNYKNTSYLCLKKVS